MLLHAQLAILVVLVALNTWLGIDMQLYYSIWWWDIPTHFLGGVWVGLCAAWILTVLKKKISLVQCVGFAFVIGVGWEVFEHFAQVGGNIFMPYWLDTSKDLVVDMLGALLAGMIAPRIQKVWRR